MIPYHFRGLMRRIYEADQTIVGDGGPTKRTVVRFLDARVVIRGN